MFVDAPCSGIGALRRNPEARWRLREADLAAFAARQQRDPRRRAPAAARPAGGSSTRPARCSRVENQDVVEALGARSGDLAPVPLADVLGARAAALGDGASFTVAPHTPRHRRVLRAGPDAVGVAAHAGSRLRGRQGAGRPHPKRAPHMHPPGYDPGRAAIPRRHPQRRALPMATRTRWSGVVPSRTRMAIEVSVVRDLAALRAIEAEWRALAGDGRGRAVPRPRLAAARGGTPTTTRSRPSCTCSSGARPRAIATVAAGEIVCLAPLYRRTVKVALLDTRELRMMGDAGPRPPVARSARAARLGGSRRRRARAQADRRERDLGPDRSRAARRSVARSARTSCSASRPAGFTVESAPSAGGASRIALAPRARRCDRRHRRHHHATATISPRCARA